MCVCFVCLPKSLTPTSHRGIKPKCGSALAFSHPHANQQLFLIFPAARLLDGLGYTYVAISLRRSEGSAAFTYGADRGGRIMWQLCDDGRRASHRSDMRSGSDLLFATWRFEPSWSRRILIKQQRQLLLLRITASKVIYLHRAQGAPTAPWGEEGGSQIEIKPETQQRLKNSSAFLLAASQTVRGCRGALQINIHKSE